MVSPSQPDWTLWRSFEAVVSAGSLSAAARKISLSQPTLSRHIETLETDLGISLFQRHLRGLTPTPVALAMFEKVKNAQTALAEASLLAQGEKTAPKGTVRITASVVTSHYILPKMLASIRKGHPQIDLELVPTDSTENLLMRDADIAIRMFQPTQNELITKKIADSSLSACAHKDYLAIRSTPKSMADLAEHDIIGFDKSDLILREAQHMGFRMQREHFCFRTDSQTAIWELIKAGCGIGFAQTCVIQRAPDLVSILPGLQIPPLPVWLTTHPQIHLNRHVRAIFDALDTHLKAYYADENT